MSATVHTSNGHVCQDFPSLGFPKEIAWDNLRVITVPARSAIFRQGELADAVFSVRRGLLKLVRGHSSGAESIVGLRANGWILGASAAVLGEAHTMSAVALAPTQVARIPASEFRRRLREDPEFSLRVHEMHCREIHTEFLEKADLKSASARERLERCLQSLMPGDPAASALHQRLPLCQWEIAQLVGITPQYLCRLMADLSALAAPTH